LRIVFWSKISSFVQVGYPRLQHGVFYTTFFTFYKKRFKVHRNLIRCRPVPAAPKKQNFEVTEVTSISDRRRAPDAGVQAKSKRTNAARKA